MKYDIGEAIVPAAVLGAAGYVAGRWLGGKRAGMGAGLMGAAVGAGGVILAQGQTEKRPDSKQWGAVAKALQKIDVTRDQELAASEVEAEPT